MAIGVRNDEDLELIVKKCGFVIHFNFRNDSHAMPFLCNMFSSPQQTKIRRITRPRFAIRQKLAASEIIRLWNYEKVGRVIWLEYKSNTCILDEYGEYSKVNFYTTSDIAYMQFVNMHLLDSGSSNSTSLYQNKSPTFSIRLDDESGVGTLIRRYLQQTKPNQT